VGGLWGNSTNEVFIALAHRDTSADCGRTSLLWFDGARLHPL
jgi:hypothetical protein